MSTLVQIDLSKVSPEKDVIIQATVYQAEYQKLTILHTCFQTPAKSINSWVTPVTHDWKSLADVWK